MHTLIDLLSQLTLGHYQSLWSGSNRIYRNQRSSEYVTRTFSEYMCYSNWRFLLLLSWRDHLNEMLAKNKWLVSYTVN